LLSVNGESVRGAGVARAAHLVRGCVTHARSLGNHPVLFELEARDAPRAR
jgi:hypothetical protein